MFAVSDKASFQFAKLCVQNIRKNHRENIPIFLVANKSDMIRYRKVSSNGKLFQNSFKVLASRGRHFIKVFNFKRVSLILVHLIGTRVFSQQLFNLNSYVFLSEAIRVADIHNCQYFETSLTMKYNLDELFREIVNQVDDSVAETQNKCFHGLVSAVRRRIQRAFTR